MLVTRTITVAKAVSLTMVKRMLVPAPDTRIKQQKASITYFSS